MARGSREGRRGHLARYRRYTGGPDPLAPPVDLRDALDEIVEALIADRQAALLAEAGM